MENIKLALEAVLSDALSQASGIQGVRANVINASQNALCAIGAVIVFNESLSPLALLGIGLTISGLLVLDRR